jgi:hypothetical protein
VDPQEQLGGCRTRRSEISPSFVPNQEFPPYRETFQFTTIRKDSQLPLPFLWPLSKPALMGQCGQVDDIRYSVHNFDSKRLQSNRFRPQSERSISPHSIRQVHCADPLRNSWRLFGNFLEGLAPKCVILCHLLREGGRTG